MGLVSINNLICIYIVFSFIVVPSCMCIYYFKAFVINFSCISFPFFMYIFGYDLNQMYFICIKIDIQDV